MNQAIQAAHIGLFLNQGQACCAGSRIYVESSAYDKFVEASVEAARARVVGDPFDSKTVQGPQVSREQFDKIMGYIDSGRKQGARLVTGGTRVGDRGHFIAPTVFADVCDNMTISQEEIFGPVMSISKFDSISEVIRRANDTKYGLAAAVFTNDIGKAHKIANKVRAGTVWVNCYDVLDSAVPFGGFKQSGIGRELGEYGLQNYLEIKTVTINTRSRD